MAIWVLTSAAVAWLEGLAAVLNFKSWLFFGIIYVVFTQTNTMQSFDPVP